MPECEVSHGFSVRSIRIGPVPLRPMPLAALVYTACYRLEMQWVGALGSLAGAMVQFQTRLVTAHEQIPQDSVCKPLGCVRALRYKHAITAVVQGLVPKPAALDAAAQALPKSHKV